MTAGEVMEWAFTVIAVSLAVAVVAVLVVGLITAGAFLWELFHDKENK